MTVRPRLGAHVDLAEPAAPGRLLAGSRASEPGSPRVTGCLTPSAESLALKGCSSTRPVGVAGSTGDSGVRDRLMLAGVVVAGGDQQRAALLHVAGDVVVVEQLQDVAVLVAVEDDEVEVLDLLGEQLARREGDQRELVDRRAVLLLRRAQNGEVHEVDGGVRLQQVAPRALAGVRLARDQQHAQVLAHALGRDHHAVVGGRQLARRRLELDLDDVLARRAGTASGS